MGVVRAGDVSTVHIVGPAGVSDPARPSGGNTYHRMMCTELAALGWTTHEWLVEGGRPGEARALARVMARLFADIPDRSVVLLDGLVALPMPDVLVPEADRLRLVVVVHLPLGLDAKGRSVPERRTKEGAVLHAAAAVVTTSRWTRDWLLATYRLEPRRVHVVSPGVRPADLGTGSSSGGRLLCVGAVSATKGHDVLVEALAAVADLAWSCRFVGSVAVEPDFARRAVSRARDLGLGERVVFTGPRVDGELDAEYAVADVLVAPSRIETYGLVVTEALARGVPVLGAAVGGLPEAMGTTLDGQRPGMLVPPADSASLGAVLRDWLTDAGLREGLRAAARARRVTLSNWSDTAHRLSTVLSGVAA